MSKRKNESAMISVDADYIKQCIRSKRGNLEKVSKEMGYNEAYLSCYLSKNKQSLLPVVLDYLVKNYGIDKNRAIARPLQERKADENLSAKMDVLIERMNVLERSMFGIQKYLVEIKEMWK